MFHMLGHIFFGLIVGIVAKLLMPGHDPGGVIVTILLGIAGAWLGGQIGQWLGWYEAGHPAGFMMAVLGAILLLFLYRHTLGSAPPHHAALPPSATFAIVVSATRQPEGLTQLEFQAEFGG